MTLLMQIKADLLKARKSDDQLKKNLLSTLYSETALLGKKNGNRPAEDITDDETIGVIKKFIKGAEEAYKLALDSNRSEKASEAQAELDILKSYLPAQLSDEFLEQFVKDFLAKSPQQGKQVIGSIMKELNRQYKGQFDGRKANEIINRLIS
jgi:uncharacterized protein YqeY